MFVFTNLSHKFVSFLLRPSSDAPNKRVKFIVESLHILIITYLDPGKYSDAIMAAKLTREINITDFKHSKGNQTSSSIKTILTYQRSC